MLTRMIIRCAALALPVLGAPYAARAQSPETVSVAVELRVPRFRDRFTDRGAVEQQIARVFTAYLERNVGFLRFTPDDSPRPYRLTFVLDRATRGGGTFSEVGFFAHLDRPGDTPVESYWLPLRTADQALAGVGTEADLVTEIRAKLAHHDPDSLRRGLLRWVPIAEAALPNLDPLGVVLPFRLLDLCMKPQSVIEFVVELEGAITMEEQFRALIVGRFTPPSPHSDEIRPYVGGGFGKVIDLPTPDDLAPSIRSRRAHVRKVFVTSYVHDPTACENRVPGAIAEGGR